MGMPRFWCLTCLAEATIESHFLENPSLSKLEIFFSLCAVHLLSHHSLNNLSKKSGLGLQSQHRLVYFWEPRKKTLCQWKLHVYVIPRRLSFLTSCPSLQNKKQIQECHHLESQWPLSEWRPTSSQPGHCHGTPALPLPFRLILQAGQASDEPSSEHGTAQGTCQGRIESGDEIIISNTNKLLLSACKA